VLPDSTTESDDDGAQAPRRSKRKPAPKFTWCESNPKAYVAAGPFGGAKSAWDLSKPPTNAKEARARSDWPLWKAAEKEEYLAHKKLGTWSKTKRNNKRKAVKIRYVYDIKRDSEGNVTRYKARLVAQASTKCRGVILTRRGRKCPARQQHAHSSRWPRPRTGRFTTWASRRLSSTRTNGQCTRPGWDAEM